LQAENYVSGNAGIDSGSREKNMIDILIVDDMKLLRESIKITLEKTEDFNIVGCASNGYEAVSLCRELVPDVVLMDIIMPEYSGIEATRDIKTENPNLKVLVLTTESYDNSITSAISMGADGYVLKNIGIDELNMAIRSVYMGLTFVHRDAYSYGKPDVQAMKPESVSPPSYESVATFKVNGFNVNLSKSEQNVFQLIAEGKLNDEIASMLNISKGRVANIISDILSKLMLENRIQLTVFAIKNRYNIFD
jgi:DNA-binding NarL/FixJ family response regulator